MYTCIYIYIVCIYLYTYICIHVCMLGLYQGFTSCEGLKLGLGFTWFSLDLVILFVTGLIALLKRPRRGSLYGLSENQRCQ